MKKNNRKPELKNRNSTFFYLLFSILCLVLLSTFYFLISVAAAQEDSSSTVASEADQGAESVETAAPGANAVFPEQIELERQINQRNEELKEINKRLTETEQSLVETQGEKTSLQREIRSIKSNISQLNLNIQADGVVVKKLGLEIDSLSYDIRDIEISVQEMKKSVGELLRKIQRNSRNNFLTILLKGDSLAESVLEAQNISDLGAQLAVDVISLGEFRGDLDGKLTSVSDRRDEISFRQSNLKVRKSIVEEENQRKSEILVQTKNQESLYEQQLDELRAKQDEIAKEIARIEDELRVKFDASLLPTKRPGVFAWPVALKSQGGKGIITQHFGEISNLYGGRPHNGLDIGVPVGTPVFAGEEGRVMAVDNNDRSRWSKYQYGKYVLIEHSNNLATLYAHLSEQTARVGDSVKRGDLIGYSGTTGYSTGPHVHFGLYWAPSILMKTIPPASGLVPVGVVIAPEDYL